MLLKELYKKYNKEYNIKVYGRPLNEMTIPFTLLPKGKDMMECEVVDYRIIDIESDEVCFKLTSGGIKGNGVKHNKGSIDVYIQ